MIKNNIKWIVLCLVFILGGLGYFYTFYERVEYQEPIYPSYEVRHKTFYAAENFLKSHGIKATSTKHRGRLINLPEPTSALFVPFLNDSLNEEQVNHLMDWVRQGGYLFVFADPDEAWYELEQSDNPILRQMNVRLTDSENLFPNTIFEYCNAGLEKWMQCLNDDSCQSLVSKESILQDAVQSVHKGAHEWAYRNDEAEDKPVRQSSRCTSHYCYSKKNEAVLNTKINPVFLHSGEHPNGLSEDLEFDLARNVSLEVYEGQADVVFQSDSTIAGLQFFVGEGMVSIFNSYEFLSQHTDRITKNEGIKDTGNHIGRHDHAYFLWQSVKDRSSVWFFESIEYTGFVKLALKNIPYFLLTAAFGLMLFLLWLARKLGPNHPSVDQPRRSVLEHLQMSADFEWRLDKCAQLLNKNQTALISLIHKKHPKTKRLNQTECACYLSERLGLNKENIYTALYASAENERQFISITQHLQNLRNSL